VCAPDRNFRLQNGKHDAAGHTFATVLSDLTAPGPKRLWPKEAPWRRTLYRGQAKAANPTQCSKNRRNKGKQRPVICIALSKKYIWKKGGGVKQPPARGPAPTQCTRVGGACFLWGRGGQGGAC